MSLSKSAEPSAQTLPPVSRLIVCERSGEWAAALRIELIQSGVKLRECRGLPDAWTALAETSGAFLVAEATRENLSELAERLSRLRRDFPLARAAVVADRGLAECEWFMREAGAIHFVTSPRQLQPLAALVVRHLAGVPPPPQSVAEQIWASLPWARHTS